MGRLRWLTRLHQICEGHRLLTLRGQRGAEIQAAARCETVRFGALERGGGVESMGAFWGWVWLMFLG